MYAIALVYALSLMFGAASTVPRCWIPPGEYPVDVSPSPIVPKKEKP